MKSWRIQMSWFLWCAPRLGSPASTPATVHRQTFQQALGTPQPVWLQIRIYIATQNATKLPEDPNLAFCYDILNKVSRRWEQP